jgi:hypothetical protein
MKTQLVSWKNRQGKVFHAKYTPEEAAARLSALDHLEANTRLYAPTDSGDTRFVQCAEADAIRAFSYVGVKFNDAAHGGEHVVVGVEENRWGVKILRACKTGQFGGWGTYADYFIEFVDANRVSTATISPAS